jgi:hypothetical protein
MARTQNLVQRAFSQGELAPAFHARADLALYGTGAKTLRNFTVLRSGGIANRAGTRFLAAAGDSDGLVKLYRWEFTAADDSTLIEAGDEYFRFYEDGARVEVVTASLAAYSAVTTYAQGELVKDGGIGYYALRTTINDTPASSASDWYPLPANGASSIYEIPTPYTAGSFNSPGPLRFTQNGRNITITHTGYRPYLLTNQAGVNDPYPEWVLTLQTTAPTITAPTTPLGTEGAAGNLTFVYVVTAVLAETLEESLPSATITLTTAAAPTQEDPHSLSWTAPAGFTVAEYRVYLDDVGNGVFGYIGTAKGQTSFFDAGFAPDYLLTPPQARALFETSLNYPEVNGYFQQRQLFGYTDNEPAAFWASRTGFPLNFSIRSPLQDDDAVTGRMQAGVMSVIRHIIGLIRLVILTNSGEWLHFADESSGALTPRSVGNLRQVGYTGASRAFPAVVGTTIIYVGATGDTVRELKIGEQTENGVTGGDLTVLASHLFEGHTIERLEYQRAPASIVWMVRDDGVLIGMTYLPEQGTFGFHRHDTTNGLIEDICVVPEAAGDVLYMVVKRTIEGEDVRYIEQLEARPIEFTAASVLPEGFFVDSGVTYEGAATTTIDGLDHLEGQTVYGAANGLPVGPFTVDGGEITLPIPATVAHIGLPITADLETLDLDVNGSGIRDKHKLIKEVGLVLHASSGTFYAGEDTDNLLPSRREDWQSATAIRSGWSDTTIKASHDHPGRVVIRHTDATPLTILSIIPRFEVGG